MAKDEEAPAAGKGMFRLILLAGVLVVSVAAGVGASKFFGGAAQTAEADEESELEDLPSEEASGEDYAYADLEQIKVNLDTPRLERYLVTTITMAFKKTREEVVNAAVDRKKNEVGNWLNTYFAGCTLEEVGGDKNRNRIRREIRDALNEQLWPDRKPLIDHVLFKEFTVQ